MKRVGTKSTTNTGIPSYHVPVVRMYSLRIIWKMGIEQGIQEVIENEGFPPVSLAIAYGSGFDKQEGYDSKANPMLDFILVVDDALLWHRENLNRNADHYSGLAALGPDWITSVQRLPGGLYYNTLVEMKGSQGRRRLMKYGVVERADLITDLQEWKFLYLAGRLQKPVFFNRALAGDMGELGAAYEKNLASAIRASLILLPSNFNAKDLFITAAGLSYGGDIRMLFGENPDKVRNIVLPNLDRFEKLYESALGSFENVCFVRTGENFVQDDSPAQQLIHRTALPLAVSGVSNADSLRRNLRKVVRYSSLCQSSKGLVTAGVLKSGRYTGAKIAKWANWWAKRLL